jgi:DNA-directed RNA polymerase specialized sigma24 family protein
VDDEQGQEHEPGISAVAQVEQMLATGEMDGLVRRLSAKYRDRDAWVDDAVCDAVARLVRKTVGGQKIEVAAAWLYTVADNRMKTMIQRERTRGIEEDEDWPDHRDNFDDVEVQDALRQLKELMADWTETKRVVTTLALEAAAAGDPMTSEELADAASAILGREIKPNAARTTKARGLAALAVAHTETENERD